MNKYDVKAKLRLNDVFYKVLDESNIICRIRKTIINTYELFMKDSIGKKYLNEITSDDIIRSFAKIVYINGHCFGMEDVCNILFGCLRKDNEFNCRSRDVAREAINIIKGMSDKWIHVSPYTNYNMFIKSKKRLFREIEQQNILMWKYVLTVIFGTGIPYDSICALNWGDIDLDKMVIHIRRTTRYIGGSFCNVSAPKKIDIPMFEDVRDAFLCERLRQDKAKGNDNVMTYGDDSGDHTDSEAYNSIIDSIIINKEDTVFKSKNGGILSPTNVSAKITQITAMSNLREYINAFIEGREPEYIDNIKQSDIKNAYIIRLSGLGYSPKEISKLMLNCSEKTVTDTLSMIALEKELSVWN